MSTYLIQKVKENKQNNINIPRVLKNPVDCGAIKINQLFACE